MIISLFTGYTEILWDQHFKHLFSPAVQVQCNYIIIKVNYKTTNAILVLVLLLLYFKNHTVKKKALFLLTIHNIWLLHRKNYHPVLALDFKIGFHFDMHMFFIV